MNKMKSILHRKATLHLKMNSYTRQFFFFFLLFFLLSFSCPPSYCSSSAVSTIIMSSLTYVVVLLSLIVSSCFCSVKLYGVFTVSSGRDTTFTTFLGSIDLRGNITNLFELSVYFEGSVTIQRDSISGGNVAFDNTNQIFYYSDDSNSDFVYGLDVVNKKIQKLYSSNAYEVFGVAYDSSNENLVIMGMYGDSVTTLTDAVVFMPTTSNTQKASYFNFTENYGAGLSVFAGGTVDPKNSLFYTVYADVKGNQMIATITIETKKFAASPPVNCSGYLIFGLTYDSANSRLFSTGILSANNWAYLEIDTSSFACTVTPFKAKLAGIDFSAYDPTTQTIYLVNDAELYTFDIATKTLSSPVVFQYMRAKGLMPGAFTISY